MTTLTPYFAGIGFIATFAFIGYVAMYVGLGVYSWADYQIRRNTIRKLNEELNND